MFPNGRPGVALLLLRVALSAILLAHGPALWPVSGSWAICVMLACFLAVGCCIPVLAITGVLVGVVTSLEVAGKASVEGAFVLAVLAACGLLGGGAYSADALIFGRRRLIVGSDFSSRK